MTTLRKVIKYFVISMAVVITVFDVVVYNMGDAISTYLRDEAGINNWWILPYCGGILLGHLFINLHKEIKYRIYRNIALAIVTVLALVLNLTVLRWVLIPWYFTIPGGLASGALLWPQPKRELKK
jgi:hypothetical protein